MDKSEIKKFFKGDITDDSESLASHSRDASLFGVMPKLVVYPKDSGDLKKLVEYVNEKRKDNPELSITMRAAGSCMSGGSLNNSIIADVTRYMQRINLYNDGKGLSFAEIEPGAYYRDFEIKTLEQNLLLPCFPASKNMAALGGMFANNCAGEKTLRYGKMENFILESKVIFSDGKEYTVKPLTRSDLVRKMAQGDFEGNLYKRIFNLLEDNKQIIQEAKPRVSKNSAGYYLWNIYDGETFDLNKLLVGSQGTLGLITEMKLRLISLESVSKLYVIFLPNLSKLAELVNKILPTNPESLESYDDATLKLAFRFFPEMLKSLKAKSFLKLILSFIPEGIMMIQGGFPKMVLLVEYAGKTKREVDEKLMELEKTLEKFKLISRRTRSQEEANKYWTIRRESFNLLRKHVKGRRTAPFVEDVVVKPEDMPEFLPKMRKILDEYKLTYTISGHAGNGNFHIIPLMDMRNRDNIRVIKEVGDKVYNLVAEYHGSITGEHNDGIVRTPYLNKMYKPEVLELFKQTKAIFDPQNIFNPGKKVGGTIEYLEKHIIIE
ncbi:MAG: FAD-binding oxidoreductase [bacterium]